MIQFKEPIHWTVDCCCLVFRIVQKSSIMMGSDFFSSVWWLFQQDRRRNWRLVSSFQSKPKAQSGDKCHRSVDRSGFWLFGVLRIMMTELNQAEPCRPGSSSEWTFVCSEDRLSFGLQFMGVTTRNKPEGSVRHSVQTLETFVCVDSLFTPNNIWHHYSWIATFPSHSKIQEIPLKAEASPAGKRSAGA